MTQFIKRSKYLAELTSMKIWIPYLISSTHGKVPSLDGHNYAKWKHDPDLLATFRCALSCQQHKPGLVGVGLVIPEGYVILDLDDCYNPNGTLNDAARSLVNRLNTYSEKSPSGGGIHLICKNTMPDLKKIVTKIEGQRVEVLAPGNFCTFTGNAIRDTSIADKTDFLTPFYCLIYIKNFGFLARTGIPRPRSSGTRLKFYRAGGAGGDGGSRRGLLVYGQAAALHTGASARRLSTGPEPGGWCSPANPASPSAAPHTASP